MLTWRPLSGLQTGPASLDLGFGACLRELILASFLITAIAAEVADWAIDESLRPRTKRALGGGLVVLLLFRMVMYYSITTPTFAASIRYRAVAWIWHNPGE
ncbi:hypothetical protein M405DRAFT_880170, partial [Rhizopogon salebrosus TDB-379]